MFKNYFRTAWRSLINDKLHSFINIAGLSIGMTVAILIGLWLHDELSFNNSFKNHGRIAQVVQNVTNNGEVQTWWSVPYPLSNELRTNYGSDFKHIVMATTGDHIMTIGDKKLKDRGGFFEKEMPDMFSLYMIKGKHIRHFFFKKATTIFQFLITDRHNMIAGCGHYYMLKIAAVICS